MIASPTMSRIPYYGSPMPYDGWTTDDLDALAEDGIRRELVDGVLFVSPAPAHSHQSAVATLFALLDESCPADLRPSHGVEIRINHKRSLIPDVMVVAREAAERDPRIFQPSEVVLAVEIVSPTSVSIDRILKPALYAGAGIGGYWRIEPTEDYRLYAYALAPGGDVYVESGAFEGIVSVAQPWPLKF